MFFLIVQRAPISTHAATLDPATTFVCSFLGAHTDPARSYGVCIVLHSVSRIRAVPLPPKRLDKLSCELRGSGHKAYVAPGQLNQLSTELISQFHAYLMCRITA